MKTTMTQLRRRFGGPTAIGLVAVMVILLWALLPVIPQDAGYHQFTDQRKWGDVPHAADVLSNVAFALVGFIGLTRLISSRRMRFSPETEAGLWCVAIGLVCTAMGSAWYHWNPADSSLVWDRLPMTLIFAGVLSVAISQRIGRSVGRIALPVLVALGVVSVGYWKMSGDLSLYLVMQFGGMAGLLLVVLLTPKGDDVVPWRWVIVWYVLAKLAESADQAVWNLTGGVLAGHALKHLLAAAAGAAVLWPLFAGRAGHPASISGRTTGRASR